MHLLAVRLDQLFYLFAGHGANDGILKHGCEVGADTTVGEGCAFHALRVVSQADRDLAFAQIGRVGNVMRIVVGVRRADSSAQFVSQYIVLGLDLLGSDMVKFIDPSRFFCSMDAS